MNELGAISFLFCSGVIGLPILLAVLGAGVLIGLSAAKKSPLVRLPSFKENPPETMIGIEEYRQLPHRVSPIYFPFDGEVVRLYQLMSNLLEREYPGEYILQPYMRVGQLVNYTAEPIPPVYQDVLRDGMVDLVVFGWQKHYCRDIWAVNVRAAFQIWRGSLDDNRQWLLPTSPMGHQTRMDPENWYNYRSAALLESAGIWVWPMNEASIRDDFSFEASLLSIFLTMREKCLPTWRYEVQQMETAALQEQERRWEAYQHRQSEIEAGGVALFHPNRFEGIGGDL